MPDRPPAGACRHYQTPRTGTPAPEFVKLKERLVEELRAEALKVTVQA
jgi:hypothetical protein